MRSRKREISHFSQEPNRKHEYQMYQSAAADVQLKQLWNWQGDDINVENNVDDGMGPGERVEIDARPLRFTSPACPRV